ncbi:MAG: chemotaxis protein CheW [Pseudanabaenaceae cyanobacterium SKYGB_i_bin29]|nr:chemotaxis protein CheW [Pseudanabaenaceae cyanobacterium SKYG29]MDW8422496.1 chemotaxis protein CheW [Pseudanabaenaceae cyanobacterium SKYGB_i_bin29]
MELATLDVFTREITADLFNDRAIPVFTEQTRFLQFPLGGYEFLFPLANLQEIFSINLAQVTLMPGLEKYVLGIYNWRGNLAWLVDLQELLTGIGSNFRENCLCLLMPLEGQYLGMVVEQVEGIATLNNTDLLPLTAQIVDPIPSRFIQGYYLQDKPLLVLEPQGIVETFLGV